MRCTKRRYLVPAALLILWGGRDTARAASEDPTAALRKSCDKGSAADCRTVAGMYLRGEGVPKDLGKSASFQKKACEAGEMHGCFDLAAMHRTGEGVSKDLPRMVKL